MNNSQIINRKQYVIMENKNSIIVVNIIETTTLIILPTVIPVTQYGTIEYENKILTLLLDQKSKNFQASTIYF